MEIKIKINNQIKTIDELSSLFSIVQNTVGDKQKGIAVALNNKVITKNEWNNTKLNPNDSVLIIKATQGG